MGTLVAVDAQNLYFSARRAGGKVDFQSLWDHIQAVEDESMVIAYVVRGDFDTASFESLLRGIGYRISPRTSERWHDGTRYRTKHDSHEIRISLDAAVTYTDRYEKFVLVTGDNDYSDLFRVLKDQSKRTEIWSFTRPLCAAVMEVVDKVEFLGTELLKEQP